MGGSGCLASSIIYKKVETGRYEVGNEIDPSLVESPILERSSVPDENEPVLELNLYFETSLQDNLRGNPPVEVAPNPDTFTIYQTFEPVPGKLRIKLGDASSELDGRTAEKRHNSI